MDHGFSKSIKEGIKNYELLKDDTVYFSRQLNFIKRDLREYDINSEIEKLGNMITLSVGGKKLVSINHVEKILSSDFCSEIKYNDREVFVGYVQFILSSISFWTSIEKMKSGGSNAL